MNLDLRVVSRHLGLLMFVISAFILAIALFALVDRLTGVSANGADLTALLVTALLGAILAVALLMGGRKTVDLIGQREALLLVALSWLLGAALQEGTCFALLQSEHKISRHEAAGQLIKLRLLMTIIQTLHFLKASHHYL